MMPLVLGNGVTQETLLKSRFVIFRCQKYVKKRVHGSDKKNYLETLKKCPGSLHFPLLPPIDYFLQINQII